MHLTTIDRVPGRTTREAFGVVTGEAVVGVNIFRDLFAGIRDIVGGRSGGYQAALREAREAAFADMEQEAQSRGANAVVGIDIDYEVLGKSNGMLLVSVTGTAVWVD